MSEIRPSLLAEPPPSQREKWRGECRLLIVDDDEDFRLPLCWILDEAGYQTRGASSATEALAALEEFPADLALADLVMPDMDGIHLMARIRDLHPQVEMIAVTGKGTAEAAMDAMRGGAKHFLAKPFRQEELLHTVAKCLEPRLLRRERDGLLLTVALLRAGQEIGGIRDARLLAERAAQMLLRHFSADTATVFGPAVKGGARPRVLGYASGAKGNGMPPARAFALAEAALERGAGETWRSRRPADAGEVACMMSAPLLHEGRANGAALVGRGTGRPQFREDEAERIQAFAPLLASAIANANLFAELTLRIQKLESQSQNATGSL